MGPPNHGPAAELELRDRADTSLVDPAPQLELQSTARAAVERSTAYLDGLRGLAALSVFIQHYIGGFDAMAHEHGFGENGNYYLASLPFLRIIFNGGNAGVTIFFILSGYVLAKSQLRLLRSGRYDTCKRNLLSAVARRPIRLYLPPVAVALVIAVLMQVPGGLVEDAWFSQRKETLWDELANWFTESVSFFNPFQNRSDEVWYTYIFVAWTLPLELKGSILVYGLIFPYAWSGAVSLHSLWLLVIASFLLLQSGVWHMACFIMGLLLCFVDSYSIDTSFFARRHVTRRVQFILWHVLFFVGWYLLTQPAHDGSPEYSRDTPGWGLLHSIIPAGYSDEKYYYYWMSWGALLFVYATLRIAWIQNFLNRPSIRYLGKLSFMLYLIHTAFFRMFGDKVARMFGRGLGDDDPGTGWFNNKVRVPDIGPTAMSLRFLLSMAITLPATLFVSDIGYKLIDEPSVKLSKKFAVGLGLDSSGKGRQTGREDVGLPRHNAPVNQPA